MILTQISSPPTMNKQLFNSIVNFIEPHVAIVILEHTKSKNIIPEADYNKYMMNLLLKTKKYTELTSTLDALKSEIPEATHKSLSEQFAKKQEETEELLKSLDGSLQEMKKAIIKDFGSEEKFESDMMTKENTKSRFISIPKKVTDDCIKYANTLYESGKYQEAKNLIHKLLNIADHTQDLLNLHWGKFYTSFILKLKDTDNSSTNGTILFDELKQLRHRIEVRGPETYFEIISGRCSLLHYF